MQTVWPSSRWDAAAWASKKETYLWGLAKKSSSSEWSGDGKATQYFWGLIGEAPRNTVRDYVCVIDRREVARYSERDLTSMPATAFNPLTESIFADNPNATYFTTNGQVEALEMELTVP